MSSAAGQPSDPSTFRRGARDVALRHVVQLRLVLAPVLGVVATTFAVFEPTLWRRLLLAGVFTLIISVSVVEFIRFRRRGLRAIGLPFNLMVMIVGQLMFITATGGLFSPIVPALIVVTVVGAIMFGDVRLSSTAAVVCITALWALAFAHGRWPLIPVVFGDAQALEQGPARWVFASVYTFMIAVAARLGIATRTVFDELFSEALIERDRRLAVHAEQSAALSALSAEIAHELKNPLASVKGLAALVARDIEGKPAERTAVLRREVDRMQGILEELLNFSRPLVPLTMEDVDVADLARDVVRLHEGSAVSLGVSLRAEGSAASLTCDPRKVRQILINLVQNALEASPRGGTVTVVVEGGDPTTVVIEDAGPGIAADLRERVFEAGVTTKDTGSGIGLVVARSLARQHGGDLELDSPPAGGCRAILILPSAPVETVSVETP